MKNNNDYFVFCIVLVEDREQALSISEKIQYFRKKHNLPDNHEFHYATDSKKTRVEFIKFIRSLRFNYIAVSIKKNRYQKTASFVNMAELILDALEEKVINADIIMDTNPRLYKELRTRKKNRNIYLHFSEKKSRGNDLIQLADYVTALKTRLIKHPKSSNVLKMYSAIRRKQLSEKQI